MSFKFTAPETQDIETLETLRKLVDTFGEAAMVVVLDTGVKPPVMTTEERDLFDELEMAVDDGNKDRKTIAELRLGGELLKILFEAAATVEGTQEKMLTFVPQDLGSKVNADLIEKYELTGLATLAQKAKDPNPL